MIVLLGESASGKSSVEKMLVNNYGFKKIITYTTRPLRQGEVDGIDYHFISKNKFNKLKASKFFVETETYNNWEYGISTLDNYINDKVIILTPHGMRKLKTIKGIFSFYIKVPRRDRLIKILQRGDDIDEAYRRSLSDVGQFDGIEDEVNFVIDNPQYHKSVKEITNEILNILNTYNTY